MPSVKKIKPLPSPVEREIAVDALAIFFFERKFEEFDKISRVSDDNRKKYQAKFLELKAKFKRKHNQNKHDLFSNFDHMTIIVNNFFDWSNYLELFRPKVSPDEMYDRYVDLFKQSEMRPLKIGYKNEWAYKGFVYSIQGHYSEDEIRLLILEDFDKERKYFEKLKAKFDDTSMTIDTFDRPRIPESVRVEVWRRDGGKCARCGSRERLEYDHIVPISKGGSNTARNIELLCEKHNRSKSNNVI